MSSSEIPPNVRVLKVKKKRPKQSRSIETQARILECSERLFSEKGFAGTRIEDIVEQSGTSIGSFYHRFEDKLEVFAVIFEEYEREMMEIAENFDFSKKTHKSLVRAIHHFATSMISYNLRRSGLRRTIYELEVEIPELRARAADVTAAFCERFSQFSTDYREDLVGEGQAHRMKQALQAIQILATRASSTQPMIYFDLDQDKFAGMLTDVALGILGNKSVRETGEHGKSSCPSSE